MGYQIYEYTQDNVTIILKALNPEDAFDLLIDKCNQEDLPHPLRENLQHIHSEDDASGVIAFIDYRI